MRFNNLKIENFRSFQGIHEFDFNGNPVGLNDIRGPNGAGKSSIMEAVFWILFGKTTRNLKAGNIQNWATKGKVSGVLDMEHDGRNYTIHRTWAPVGLKVNGIDVDQSSIDNILRLTADSFQHAIYISQFATTFFDLAPTPKLAVFSKILNLDVWLNRSIRAGEAAKKHQTELNKAINVLSTLDGRIDQISQQIEDYNKKAVEFDAEQAKKLVMYQQQWERCATAHRTAMERIAQLEGDLPALELKINTVKRDQIHETEIYNELDDLLKELSGDERELRTRLKLAQSDLSKYEAVGEECSVCLQKVGQKHRKAVLADMQKEVDSWSVQLNDLLPQITETKELHAECAKALSDIRRELQLAEKSRDKVADDIRMVKASANQQNQDLIRINNLIASTKKESNPFDALLVDADTQSTAIVNDYDAATAEKERLTVRLEHASFWVNGFKEIRLFVLEQALTTLEVEINNYLAELGLLGWSISFDVERETKSGSVSKGFVANIQSPHAEHPVPWEAWSGGELQRLRIAGALGIANIIRRYAGVTNAPLVLDEPTKHMDKCDELLITLDRIASSEGIPIWFIDHRTHDYGGFKSITNVEKTENGTKIARVA